MPPRLGRSMLPVSPASGTSPLRVSVPCSTSNLGPGFDFLGLALSLHLEVRLLGSSRNSEHVLETCEGTAVEWPRAGTNLLFLAFDDALARLGEEPRYMRFGARSVIPIARGLGSSGAAVAAGLLLAAAVTRHPATPDELVTWGLALEGHPDNVCAALLGGCTLSVPRPQGGVRVVRQELHPDLGFALAWSSRQLATSLARSVLPREVAFDDAVENPRRLALLLEGLRLADAELLSLGGEDRLHVRYRLPLIPGGEAALHAAREAGAWLATVSGSGSSLIAIGSKACSQAVADAMCSALRAHNGDAEGRVVSPVFGAPQVERLG